jgi:YebC/PmpR family DNA-binding regulatory protein
MGGGDINANTRLRTAVYKARENNMPNDNIERAIKKATGEMNGVTYDEVRYEGYGPGGVAIMVDCLTDNRNRTAPEIRAIFSKNGGNLGDSGCVSYLFTRKGLITIDAGQTTEDEMMEFLLDYGIDDVRDEDGAIVVETSPESFNGVYEKILEKGYRLLDSGITFIPQTTTSLDEKKARQCMNLVELLEEQDDAQNVYSNYDISDEIMALIEGEG